MTKINKFLESIIGPFNNPYFKNPLTPEAIILQQKVSTIQNSLGELNPYEIPFEWVEPNAKTKRNLNLGVDKGSVKVIRQNYEWARARHLINEHLLEISSKDPQTEAILKLNEEISKNRTDMTSVTSNCNATNSQACSERFQSLYSQMIELGNKRNKLLSEQNAKYKSQLITYGEELKKQPYSHEEGRENFVTALEQMNYDKIDSY